MALTNEDWLRVRQGDTEYKVQVGALSLLFSTQAEHADVLKQLGELQEGFDEAVLAAQDGADNVVIELQSYAKKDHSHDYATPGHNHNSNYVKGNWTITKSGGNWYIS